MNSGINSIIDKSIDAYVFNFTGNQDGRPFYKLAEPYVQYCITGSLGPTCQNTGNNFINIKSGGALSSLNNLVFNTNSPLSIYFIHKWSNMEPNTNYSPFSIDCLHNGVLTRISPNYRLDQTGFISSIWGPSTSRTLAHNYLTYEKFINKIQIDEWHFNNGAQTFSNNNLNIPLTPTIPLTLSSSNEIIGFTGNINQNYSFGELLVFSGLLSTSEKSGIYRYLCNKWCINTFTGFKDIFIGYGVYGITHSTNGGQSWSKSLDENLTYLSHLDISNNGVGVAIPFICYSPKGWWRTLDNGQSWNKITTFPPGISGFTSMAISNNGDYILAAGSITNCNFGGNNVVSTNLYISNDQGNSWSVGVNTPSPSFNWKKTVNINQNGSVMIAGIGANQVYLSYDFGNSWTLKNIPLLNSSSFAISLDMSCNGRHIIGYTYDTTAATNVVISNDFGNTWRQLDIPILGIQSACISNDGKYISIGDVYVNGRIYYSHNSGVSWASSTIYDCSFNGPPIEINYSEARVYTDCDSSCDGQIQVFAPFNGNTPFISYDFGVTFWTIQSWRNIDINMPRTNARSLAMNKNNVSAELFPANGFCEGSPLGGGDLLPSTTSSIFGAQSLSFLIGEDILEDLLNN